MQPLVQSALTAAQQGDKNKAMGLLKQALTENPNDIEAMLVLAGIVDQSDRKRQVLDRVLKLDPHNKLARAEILKLDRQAMGSFLSEQERPASKPKIQAVSKPTDPTNAPTAQEKSKPTPTLPVPPQPALFSEPRPPTSATTRVSFPDLAQEIPTDEPPLPSKPKLTPLLGTEKPLVFQYPLFWRIVMYFFVAFFGCVGLLIASQNFANSLPFLVLALLMGITAMAFSPKVELSEAGIRASGMFSHAEIRWEEIAGMKSVPIKRRLELTSKDGELVNVSTQVNGYARIVEILRQRRPDLFGGTAPRSNQHNPFAADYNHASAAAPISSEPKTFRKSFLSLYALSILLIPVCGLVVWSLFVEPQYRIGATLFGGFCVVLMFLPFFQVGAVKVEPNKLTFESFMEQKEFSARQIKEIKMQSVRGRYGRVTHFIHIIPAEGTRHFSLQGFSEGDELIYGTLIHWWESYRYRQP